MASSVMNRSFSLFTKVAHGLRGNLPLINILPFKQVVELRIKLNVILVKIGEEVVSSKNFGNHNQLVVIVLSMEKWLDSKNLGVS